MFYLAPLQMENKEKESGIFHCGKGDVEDFSFCPLTPTTKVIGLDSSWRINGIA